MYELSRILIRSNIYKNSNIYNANDIQRMNLHAVVLCYTYWSCLGLESWVSKESCSWVSRVSCSWVSRVSCKLSFLQYTVLQYNNTGTTNILSFINIIIIGRKNLMFNLQNFHYLREVTKNVPHMGES